jgi:hypothetical protein
MNITQALIHFLESKDHLIKKNSNLNMEQKATLIDFFKSHPNFEKKIDWNNKNLQWDDFEPLIGESATTKSHIKKTKNWRALLETKDNIKIIFENDKVLMASPLEWEAAIFMDSANCGGEPAKWCIGYEKSPKSWDDYVLENKNGFILCLFKKETSLEKFRYHGESFVKKVMMQVESTYDVTIWTPSDTPIHLKDGWDENFANNILGVDLQTFWELNEKALEINKQINKENIVPGDVAKILSVSKGFFPVNGTLEGVYNEESIEEIIGKASFNRRRVLTINSFKGNETYLQLPINELFEEGNISKIFTKIPLVINKNVDIPYLEQGKIEYDTDNHINTLSFRNFAGGVKIPNTLSQLKYIGAFSSKFASMDLSQCNELTSLWLYKSTIESLVYPPNASWFSITFNAPGQIHEITDPKITPDIKIEFNQKDYALSDIVLPNGLIILALDFENPITDVQDFENFVLKNNLTIYTMDRIPKAKVRETLTVKVKNGKVLIRNLDCTKTYPLEVLQNN